MIQFLAPELLTKCTFFFMFKAVDGLFQSTGCGDIKASSKKTKASPAFSSPPPQPATPSLYRTLSPQGGYQDMERSGPW